MAAYTFFLILVRGLNSCFDPSLRTKYFSISWLRRSGNMHSRSNPTFLFPPPPRPQGSWVSGLAITWLCQQVASLRTDGVQDHASIIWHSSRASIDPSKACSCGENAPSSRLRHCDTREKRDTAGRSKSQGLGSSRVKSIILSRSQAPADCVYNQLLSEK